MLLLGTLLPALAAVGTAPVQGAAAQTATACDGSLAADYNGPCGPSLTLPRWGDAAGWDQPQYAETMLLADFDGDGADELLARGRSGFNINRWSAPAGQWVDQGTQQFGGYNFADGAVWDQVKYYATVQAAELGTGNGNAAALLMNGPHGIVAFQWDGQQSWTALPAGPNWNDWDQESLYLTIQTWGNWLIGRRDSGIETWRFVDGAWKQECSACGDQFTGVNGWGDLQYFPSIRLADLDGDGTPELLGRTGSGMAVYTWGGTRWTLATEHGPLSDADGWFGLQYALTTHYADIDGKPGDELLARAPDGMLAYTWDTSGWHELVAHSGIFPDSDHWDQPQYYESIQLFTLTAGQVVVTARGSQGVVGNVFNVGSGKFEQIFNGPALADSVWSTPAHYLTIRYGDTDGDGTAELVARGKYGVRSWAFDAAANLWQRPLAYGFQPFSDTGLQAAFDLLNDYLDIEQGNTVRTWYTSLNTQVGQNYQECLNYSLGAGQPQPPTQSCYLTPPTRELANPHNVTAEQWSAMVQLIQQEIALVGDVDGFFNESMSAVLNDLFAGNDNSLTNIANKLALQEALDESASGSWASLLLEIAQAFFDLADPEVEVVADAYAAAAEFALSDPSSGGSNFSGTVAQIEGDLVNLNNRAIDQNNAVFQYIAQDYGLLYAVGEMISDQTWLITAETHNKLVSAGRLQFATWTYQTLLPTVWQMVENACFNQCPPTDAQWVYFAGPTTKDPGGWWVIELWTRAFFPKDVGNVQPLFMLFSPIQGNCQPGPQGQVWTYGSCNLGISRDEFFRGEGGWKIECHLFAVNGDPCIFTNSVALAVPHLAAGEDDIPMIDVSSSDAFHLAVLSSPELDARRLDPTTVTFASAPVIGWWVGNSGHNPDGTLNWPEHTLDDVNDDGLVDVLLNFQMDAIQLEAGTTEAYLEGATVDGANVVGVLRVSVMP